MVKQLKNCGTTPKKVPFGPGLTIDIVGTNYQWCQQVLMWVSENVPKVFSWFLQKNAKIQSNSLRKLLLALRIKSNQRNSMKFLVAIAIIILIGGCTSSSTQHRPESYYSDSPATDDGADLFGSGELLSDTDIERILNYRLKLPEKNRVAILKLSKDSYWQYYSNDFTQLTDSISKEFIQTLVDSDKIYDASFLPSMLVPEKRTVPYLREAAARYQADLLLVYRSSCRSYQKYRFVSPDETKAYCSVEAALLDIRKGIVPFTSVSTNEFMTVKDPADTNFSETKKKAELEAISKSLGEVAKELVSFLSKF